MHHVSVKDTVCSIAVPGWRQDEGFVHGVDEESRGVLAGLSCVGPSPHNTAPELTAGFITDMKHDYAVQVKEELSVRSFHRDKRPVFLRR
jgi:hypothetical protein